MKQISLYEFKRMKAGEIKDSPCVEVTSDGDPLFICVVGVTGYMKTTITGHCSQIDAAMGKA